MMICLDEDFKGISDHLEILSARLLSVVKPSG